MKTEPSFHNPSAVAIAIRGVTVHLRKQEILEDITCEVPAGRITAVIGPNGAGKTTLLLAVLGQVPYSGRITFPVFSGGRPRIGYVPQRLDLDRGLPCTVQDLLALALKRGPHWTGIRDQTRKRIREGLDRVGAGRLENHFLGKLSGGEMQRVLLALALEGDPDILLLDEPTAGVDAPGEQLFCDVLSDLQRERNLTVLLISHDLSVVSNHAEQVICLNKTVRCSGGLSVLSEENLLKTYGLHIQIYPHSHGPHCRLPVGISTEEPPKSGEKD